MKKILIVDDEPHIALVIKQFLERAGLNIFTALNGKLATDFIKKEFPPAIIVDVQMPVMGGIELCEILQQTMPDYKPIIILMTTRLDRDSRIWAKQHELVSVMEKPISVRRILSTFKNHLDHIKE